MPDEMYTVEQAAAILGLDVGTIRLLIRQGKLRAWQLAGQRGLLVRKSDLDPAVRDPAIAAAQEGAGRRAELVHLIHPAYMEQLTAEPLPLYCGQTEATCGSLMVIDPSAAHSDGDGFDNMAEADVFTWQDLKSKVCMPCLLTYLQDKEGGGDRP